MTGRFPRFVLLDSGFWIGLLDPRDEQHARCHRISEKIQDFHVLVPWPTLYEFVNTRNMHRPDHVARLGAAFRMPGVRRIDDGPYREDALAECLASHARRRPMSLVDCVLRHMIADVNLHMDTLVTFNLRDFGDAHRLRQGLEVLHETPG